MHRVPYFFANPQTRNPEFPLSSAWERSMKRAMHRRGGDHQLSLATRENRSLGVVEGVGERLGLHLSMDVTVVNGGEIAATRWRHAHA